MEIVEYDKKYDNSIKELLTELQQYIVDMDIYKFNIIKDDYGTYYLDKTLKEVQANSGKIYLMLDNNLVVGFISGIIKDSIDEYDYIAPKRGIITELIITNKVRNNGIGKRLLEALENYFKDNNCFDIIIEVFGYNTKALNFYEKNGYHVRSYDVSKKL